MVLQHYFPFNHINVTKSNKCWSSHGTSITLCVESAVEFKRIFCSNFYQQSSDNKFQTNWRQCFMYIILFNNIVDCFLYRNISR